VALWDAEIMARSAKDVAQKESRADTSARVQARDRAHRGQEMCGAAPFILPRRERRRPHAYVGGARYAQRASIRDGCHMTLESEADGCVACSSFVHMTSTLFLPAPTTLQRFYRFEETEWQPCGSFVFAHDSLPAA
jgi:hypothetical protein